MWGSIGCLPRGSVSLFAFSSYFFVARRVGLRHCCLIDWIDVVFSLFPMFGDYCRIIVDSVRFSALEAFFGLDGCRHL